MSNKTTYSEADMRFIRNSFSVFGLISGIIFGLAIGLAL